MSYRVTADGWSGGASLAQSTPVVVMTPGLLAQLNAAFPGWLSASAAGDVFTFYYTRSASYLGYGYANGPTTTLQVDTLGATICGMTVLINTGIGAGWTLGTVVADVTNQIAATLASPLASTLRAITGLTGYTAPVVGGSSTYKIAGRSADAGHIIWAANGVVQFFTGATMTTLGAIAPGTIAVVETAPTTPQSDGGEWNVLRV